MRSIGPAGWGSHGYFGEHAKTFGNPTGASSGDGGPGGGPENAQIGQIAAGNGGFLMGGFLGATTATQFTAVRFNAVFNALATQADSPVANLADGVDEVFFVAGNNFVVSDGTGAVANDQGDGTAFTLAVNPGAGSPNGPYALTYDAVNARIIMSDFQSTNMFNSPNATPLNLVAHATGATQPIGPVAYKGTGGITLAIGQGGGDNGQVWKSTDGGVTWTDVAAAPFVGNSGYFIGFGTTQWLAVGGEGSTSNIQTSVSTDDGATWSAATNLAGDVPSGANPVAVATDGAGNWVVIANPNGGVGPNNYWVSNDDGATFVAPGIFAAQGGAFAGSLIHNGTHWLAAWWDATATFTFLASSTDGRTWVAGPTVIEAT